MTRIHPIFHVVLKKKKKKKKKKSQIADNIEVTDDDVLRRT